MLTHRFGFVGKSLPHDCVTLVQRQLDHHKTTGLLIFGFPHLTHTALAKTLSDFVTVVDNLIGFEVHGFVPVQFISRWPLGPVLYLSQ